MLLRRKIATVVGALALAAPLSSCGFDYATDQSYNPAVGINDGAGTIDVLNAVIVTGQEGSGTLVAAVANGAVDEEGTDTLTSITAAQGTDLTVAEIEPIELGPEGFVQLGEQDIDVTGTVTPGDVVTLAFEFESGLTIDADVSVVTNCDEFEGYDSASGSSPSEPTESAHGEDSHSEEPGDTVEPSEGNASALPEETQDADPYSCEYAQHEGGH